MKTSTVETWVWVLIYGGLLLACLSVFVTRESTPLAWVLGGTGAVATLLGAVLIYLRSRMKN